MSEHNFKLYSAFAVFFVLGAMLLVLLLVWLVCWLAGFRLGASSFSVALIGTHIAGSLIMSSTIWAGVRASTGEFGQEVLKRSIWSGLLRSRWMAGRALELIGDLLLWPMSTLLVPTLWRHLSTTLERELGDKPKVPMRQIVQRTQAIVSEASRGWEIRNMVLLVAVLGLAQIANGKGQPSPALDYGFAVASIALLFKYVGWLIGPAFSVKLRASFDRPLLATVGLVAVHSTFLALAYFWLVDKTPVSDPEDIVANVLAATTLTDIGCLQAVACGDVWSYVVRLANVGFSFAVLRNIVGIVIDPQNDKVRLTRGMDLLMKQDFAHALEHLSKVEVVNEKVVDAKCVALLGLKRFDDALQAKVTAFGVRGVRADVHIAGTGLCYDALVLQHDAHGRYALFRFLAEQGMDDLALAAAMETAEIALEMPAGVFAEMYPEIAGVKTLVPVAVASSALVAALSSPERLLPTEGQFRYNPRDDVRWRCVEARKLLFQQAVLVSIDADIQHVEFVGGLVGDALAAISAEFSALPGPEKALVWKYLRSSLRFAGTVGDVGPEIGAFLDAHIHEAIAATQHDQRGMLYFIEVEELRIIAGQAIAQGQHTGLS